jgi:hypothetical protein
MQEWLRDKSLNVLEWPRQSSDFNQIKHFWRDLKIAVQQHSPSNLSALVRLCREEWLSSDLHQCRMKGAHKIANCNKNSNIENYFGF